MKILFIIVILFICFLSYVRYLERHSIFYPSKNLENVPSDLGMLYEDIYFQTQDGVKLNAWFIAGDPGGKTVLFIHGNAGNIGDRMNKIGIFHALGVNVFIVDYRGYGKSEGEPSEQGVYLDMLATYDYLIDEKNIAAQDIVVYGVSLGGAFAVDLATKREVAALIVDASFSSGLDMARRMFPYVPSFLIKTQLNSAQKVKTLTMPKLFLHSRADEIVPFDLGKKLFDMAAQPKQLVELLGGHNDAHEVDRDKFISTLNSFLNAK